MLNVDTEAGCFDTVDSALTGRHPPAAREDSHRVLRSCVQARRVIHDNDVERLRQLLAEYPALLSWHGDREE